MRKIITGLAVAFVSVFVGTFVTSLVFHAVHPTEFLPGPRVSVEAASVPRSEAPQVDDCHYAVVCGGIHSFTALRDLVESRESLASLYADFDFTTAKMLPLPQNELLYVSYKKNGHIFFTRKPLLIRKGEIVFLDAEGFIILSRCGNSGYVDVQTPTSPDEPKPTDIYPDLPSPITFTPYMPTDMASVYDTPKFAVEFTEPVVLSDDLNPPVYPPCCLVGVGGGNSPSEHTPVATPEPGSLALLAVGIAGVGLWRTRK